MKKREEDFQLHLQPRESETVAVGIPQDVLRSLRKIAANRDMSVEALIKFYVGQGLRQDLSRQYADHVLETAAQVLTRHIQSEEEITTILREIQAGTAA